MEHRRLHLNIRKHFLLWGWWSTGTGFPGSLWCHLPWRSSGPTWTWSWALNVPPWAGSWNKYPPEGPDSLSHSGILWIHWKSPFLGYPACCVVAGTLNISSSPQLQSLTREPVLCDPVWITGLVGQWPNSSFCYTHLVLWASLSGRVVEPVQIHFIKQKCILVQAVSKVLSKQNTLQYDALKRSPKSLPFGKSSNLNKTWLRNNTILKGILLFLAQHKGPLLTESFLGCTI